MQRLTVQDETPLNLQFALHNSPCSVLLADAEGIEHPDQHDLLHSWGCHLGQGYHYSKPLAHGEFSGLLSRP